ncbi:hypothetical protein [Blastococcus litoris]|uniref:hypothetical protein n=1 Tax=Blastococcus litoris TaxID=2171622 RepID=UPI0013DFE1E4|nr:hypothetical protein [Blastococcus litoris]
MPVSPATALRGLLSRRLVAGRDPVELARELVGAGCLVAFEGGDAALVARARGAGLAGSCELAVPVDRLDAVRGPAEDAGVAIAVTGPPAVVDELAPPGARIVVRADQPGADERCRRLAGRRIRLEAGPGHRAGLGLVRCLNVLMAADGHLGVAVSDPRLVAIAGERAAWNGRPSDSWELVMPYGVLLAEQRRLVAAGSALRVGLAVAP